VKSLEELGHWRCGGCGAWNGEESAAKKVLADIKAEAGPVVESDPELEAEHRSSASTDDGVIVARDEEEDEDQEQEQENVESQSSSRAETPSEEVEEEEPPRTRSQARRRGRKG
jgi:hypothetical protein